MLIFIAMRKKERNLHLNVIHMQMVNVYACVHKLYSFKSECINANELVSIEMERNVKCSCKKPRKDGSTPLRLQKCQSGHWCMYDVDFINEMRQHR